MKTSADIAKWAGDRGVLIASEAIIWHWNSGMLWLVVVDEPDGSDLEITREGFVEVVHTHRHDGTSITVFEVDSEIPIGEAPAALQKKYGEYLAEKTATQAERLTEVFRLARSSKGSSFGYQIVELSAALAVGLSKEEVERCKRTAEKETEVERVDELGLLKSVLSGNVSAYRYYIEEEYFDVDAYFPLLHVATISGFSKVVEALISGGAYVDQADSMSCTALHHAAYSDIDDPIALVTALINAGADVDATNCDLETPLLIAAMNNKTEIGRLLVDAGADIEATTEYGETSLQVAVEENNPRFVELMISAGADLNLKNRIGQTSLIHAQREGYTEICEILLAAGATGSD